MQGKGSIPPELQEVLAVLRGETLLERPWLESSAWGGKYSRKQATIERLLLKEMTAHGPLAKEEFKPRYLAVYDALRRQRPELFQTPKLETRHYEKAVSRRYEKAVSRRYKKARQLLDEWLREWLRWGQSTALFMHKNPAIEKAIKRGWKRPIRFRWGALPDGIPLEILPAVRPSAEATACRELLIVLAHPMRTRFNVCKSCNQIFYAISNRRDRRFCSRSCSARNSLKPYMVQPEQAKLEVARRLLERAPGENWKRWLLDQPESVGAEITGTWLTRRINKGKLTLPKGLESTP
jgi:hypothetical protein